MLRTKRVSTPIENANPVAITTSAAMTTSTITIAIPPLRLAKRRIISRHDLLPHHRHGCHRLYSGHDSGRAHSNHLY